MAELWRSESGRVAIEQSGYDMPDIIIFQYPGEKDSDCLMFDAGEAEVLQKELSGLREVLKEVCPGFTY